MALPPEQRERVETAVTIMLLTRMSDTSRAACEDAQENLCAARARWEKACEDRRTFFALSATERASMLDDVPQDAFVRELSMLVDHAQESVLRTSALAATALLHMVRVTSLLEQAITLRVKA